MGFEKGRLGVYHPRKTRAIGGRERVRVSAYRVTMSDGVELDLQGRWTSPGHARLRALEYMDLTRRPGRTVTSTQRIAIDEETEKIRLSK